MQKIQIVIVTHGRIGAFLLPVSCNDLILILGEMHEEITARGFKINSDKIELQLVDDRHIQIANKKFLACQGPTNILSFPSGTQAEPATMMLSLDTLARECLFYGQTKLLHLLRLLAHGMAHLAGLDHGPEMDSVSMACFDRCSAMPQLLFPG